MASHCPVRVVLGGQPLLPIPITVFPDVTKWKIRARQNDLVVIILKRPNGVEAWYLGHDVEKQTYVPMSYIASNTSPLDTVEITQAGSITQSFGQDKTK